MCNHDAIQAPVLLDSNHHEYEKLRKHIIKLSLPRKPKSTKKEEILSKINAAEVTSIVYVCEAVNISKVHIVAEIGPMERAKEIQKNLDVHQRRVTPG